MLSLLPNFKVGADAVNTITSSKQPPRSITLLISMFLSYFLLQLSRKKTQEIVRSHLILNWENSTRLTVESSRSTHSKGGQDAPSRKSEV